MVIVQTGLADGHDAFFGGIGAQLSAVTPLFMDAAGGMDAHHREDPSRMFPAKLQHPLAGVQADGRLNAIGDVCLLHLLQQPGQIAPIQRKAGFAMGQIGKFGGEGIVTVMGMGVDDHGRLLLSEK